jgi:hypothetical protein
MNRIYGAVDRGFQPLSGQIKDNTRCYLHQISSSVEAIRYKKNQEVTGV